MLCPTGLVLAFRPAGFVKSPRYVDVISTGVRSIMYMCT